MLLVQSVDKMTNVMFYGAVINYKSVFMVTLARYAHRCADVQSANIADAVALLFATLRRHPIRILTH